MDRQAPRLPDSQTPSLPATGLTDSDYLGLGGSRYWPYSHSHSFYNFMRCLFTVVMVVCEKKSAWEKLEDLPPHPGASPIDFHTKHWDSAIAASCPCFTASASAEGSVSCPAAWRSWPSSPVGERGPSGVRLGAEDFLCIEFWKLLS